MSPGNAQEAVASLSGFSTPNELELNRAARPATAWRAINV
jgi:hypothetical protein